MPRLEQLLTDTDQFKFHQHAETMPGLQEACSANKNLATYHHLGNSIEGRPVDAVCIGTGKKTVSLIAGAHSDEPVGPETLRFLAVELMANNEHFRDLLQTYTFIIVPHINPDGDARNRHWIETWPDISTYLKHVFREPPGYDVEFGFPGMRPENRAVASLLDKQAPLSLHMSLHGMGIADGAMLLIEKDWIDTTKHLRTIYADAMRQAGLQLHDHDRKGEKGFQYIAPGFTTTPEGSAMSKHFISIGDPDTASLFHRSSMEYCIHLGGKPLCLVTEIPLFQISKGTREPGYPTTYLQLREKLPAIRLLLEKKQSISEFVEAYGITHVDIGVAVRLQLLAIQLGLDTIAAKARHRD